MIYPTLIFPIISIMKTHLTLLAATTLSLLLTPLASAAKPLKVFILSGQSNMVGLGSVTTFPAIGMDPETAPLLKKMVDAEGNPVVCDNVYISKVASAADEPAKEGKLSVGYGGGKGVRIGPEFTFGITMHELLGEPILIIKPAWGGKDLIRQFRSPSAGPFPIPEEDLAAMKAAGKDVEAAKAQREKDTGAYYKMMMEHIKKVLADPKSVYPDYDAAAGYELAGFVWFQGYNDYIQGGNSTYPLLTEDESGPCNYSEYTRLLGCFIRDIRKELAAPEMPFVVGVFGMGGKQADEKIQSFRKAQAATAELPEFKGNVVNVFTENYWPERIAQLKKQEFEMLVGTGKGKNKVFTELEGEAAKLREAIWAMKKGGDVSEKETEDEDAPKTNKKNAVRESVEKQKDLMRKFHEAVFTPEDVKLLEVGVSQQGYHYFGSAKFYAQAGKAFAEAVPGMNKVKP